MSLPSSRHWPTRCGCACSAWWPATRAVRPACATSPRDVDVTQPTISHHLKVLRDAGLLASERRASWVYYAVVPEALRNLSAVLSVATDDDVRTGASA